MQGKICRIQGKGTFIPGRNPAGVETKAKPFSWQRIADAILDSIRNGDIKRGGALPSQKFICCQFHVTPATVSKAFGALEAQGYAVKIGKRFWVGDFKSLTSFIDEKDVFLFQGGTENPGYLFREHELSASIRKMEAELCDCGMVLHFKKYDELGAMVVRWNAERKWPHGIIFSDIGRESFGSLKSLMKSLFRTAREQRPSVLFIGFPAIRLDSKINCIRPGSIHTIRGRTCAHFLFENRFRGACLFFDESMLSAQSFFNYIRIRNEIRHLDPDFSLRIFVKPAISSSTTCDFLNRLRNVYGEETARLLLSKYEDTPVDVLEREIVVHNYFDFSGIYSGTPACRIWLFANDKHAADAVMWCNSRGVKIPRDVSIMGFENEPRYYDLGISSCVPDYETIGYLMAHAVIGDIAVAKTRKGYLRLKVRIVRRRTTP